jgi:hypothetical protein
VSWFGYPVSADVQDWIAENFHWAIAQGLLSAQTPLVLASTEFFPAPRGKTEKDTVLGLVENLKTILGLEGLMIDVEPLEVLPDELRHTYTEMSSVAGTWQADENGALIRYDPTLMRMPMVLISTLAHELMHERLSWTSFDFPGAPEAEELATDLHCITMGLGAIEMAGAELAGWQGYMRQPSRAHALALFLAARQIEPKAAIAGLPPRAGKAVKRAVKEVAKSPDLVASLQQKIRLTAP